MSDPLLYHPELPGDGVGEPLPEEPDPPFGDDDDSRAASFPLIQRLVGVRLDMEWIDAPRPSDRHTGGRWAPAEPVRPAITRSACPPRSTAASR